MCEGVSHYSVTVTEHTRTQQCHSTVSLCEEYSLPSCGKLARPYVAAPADPLCIAGGQSISDWCGQSVDS